MRTSLRATTQVEGNDTWFRQQHLRLIEPAATSTKLPTFAHPAEAAIAELLTFHRVRWTYEPTTFVLERHDDGQLAECVRPDFYLPDHRLYLELTTMRQSHVTRKNRKIRRLRALYPGAEVRVLYRRDLEQIVDAESRCIAVPPPTLGERLVRARSIEHRLHQLADQLKETSTPDQVIALDAEAVPAARLLAAPLGLVPELLRLTRFQPGVSRQPIRVLRGPQSGVDGRRVLLVAGRLGTGLRCAYARYWLERHSAAQVELVTLVEQPNLQLIPVPVRAAAFTFPGCIAGFGLDIGGQFGVEPDLVSVIEGNPPG